MRLNPLIKHSILRPLCLEAISISLGSTYGAGAFSMKTIPLTKGLFAMIDDEDFERLSEFDWTAEKCKSGFYATRGKWRDGRNYTIRMHREVLRLMSGQMVDHWDSNGLNNQKYNLRICTQSQNSFNRRMDRRNKSGFKGVSLVRTKVPTWDSRVSAYGKQYCIGVFKTAKEAAEAYDRKAVELFGEFALTNKMLGLLDT